MKHAIVPIIIFSVGLFGRTFEHIDETIRVEPARLNLDETNRIRRERANKILHWF